MFHPFDYMFVGGKPQSDKQKPRGISAAFLYRVVTVKSSYELYIILKISLWKSPAPSLLFWDRGVG